MAVSLFLFFLSLFQSQRLLLYDNKWQNIFGVFRNNSAAETILTLIVVKTGRKPLKLTFSRNVSHLYLFRNGNQNVLMKSLIKISRYAPTCRKLKLILKTVLHKSARVVFMPLKRLIFLRLAFNLRRIV